MRVGIRLSRRIQQSVTVRVVLRGISAEGMQETCVCACMYVFVCS